MPVTYAIDANQKIIRTHCVGNVKLDEVLDHFRELEQDPACPDRLDVLLDLTENASLPESSQLTAVAHQIKGIQPRVQFGICAIIAPRDALFGMLRVFEVMAQPYFRVIHVFRVVADAETWLQSERLPPK